MKPLSAPRAGVSLDIAEHPQPSWLSSRWRFAALIAADSQKWGEVIKRAGIKLE